MALTQPLERPRSESAEGAIVCNALDDAAEFFRSSITYGEPMKLGLEALEEVTSEASEENWDGYGAAPVSPETVAAAVRFLETVPFDIPVPEIGATSTGDITFEWAQSPTRIVSVGVSEDGIVHYASLFGTKRNRGSFALSEEFDRQLGSLICEILG